MKTEIDTTKVLCRLCGEEFCASLCLAVFSEPGIQQQLQHKISQMFRIQISPQGNMPKQICHMCLNRLDSAYDMFKMCESVQEGIQRKVASQAQINGEIHLLADHRLTLLEEKCRSLTAHSPIIIGGSVLKLRQAPVQAEQPTPINQISQPVLGNQLAQPVLGNQLAQPVLGNQLAQPVLENQLAQPVLGNQLPQIPQNQTMVVNKNNWIPQQQQPEPVPLSYTEIMPQPAQVASAQYNYVQPNSNQVQNGGQNNINYYQQSQTTQQTTPNTSMERSVNDVQRTPRPMPVPKGKKVPRPMLYHLPSRPSPLCKKPKETISLHQEGVPLPKKPMRQCQYCKVNFAEDIIDHHVNLHRRKAFFTCIDCNKNFRTECALEKHRCGKSDGDE